MNKGYGSRHVHDGIIKVIIGGTRGNDGAYRTDLDITAGRSKKLPAFVCPTHSLTPTDLVVGLAIIGSAGKIEGESGIGGLVHPAGAVGGGIEGIHLRIQELIKRYQFGIRLFRVEGNLITSIDRSRNIIHHDVVNLVCRQRDSRRDRHVIPTRGQSRRDWGTQDRSSSDTSPAVGLDGNTVLGGNPCQSITIKVNAGDAGTGAGSKSHRVFIRGTVQ
jgi:hypothetical protein